MWSDWDLTDSDCSSYCQTRHVTSVQEAGVYLRRTCFMKHIERFKVQNCHSIGFISRQLWQGNENVAGTIRMPQGCHLQPYK